MAAKKTGLLARRVKELEDAVARLFSGTTPPGSKKPRKTKRAGVARKAKRAVKKAARKVVRKARRKSR